MASKPRVRNARNALVSHHDIAITMRVFFASLCLGWCIMDNTSSANALVSAFVTPSSLAKCQGLKRTKTQQFSAFRLHNTKNSGERADAWADGKNAAPAIMCEVEKVPILEPIPDGFKRLFLVRHGEVINPGGDRAVYYGSMDVSLSPLGELEAIEAGSYLSKFHLQHVASSPLLRAMFGARQVLARQPLSQGDSADSNDIQIFEGFKELDRGSWCGKTKEEIGPDLLARFDDCDLSVTPGDGGESYPALKLRVLQSRDELLAVTDVGRASAIVSHLQVTRAMLSEALGMDVKEMAGLKIATASITCVDYCSKTGKEIVRFQSFKPECGLEESKDGAN